MENKFLSTDISAGQVPELPDDFARSTVALARRRQRGRQWRRRVATGAVLVLALGTAVRWLNPGHPGQTAESRAADQAAADQEMALRLAEAADQETAGAYLMPDAAALASFDARDDEPSWNYFALWPESSDTTFSG